MIKHQPVKSILKENRMADLGAVLQQLKEERRLDRAIDALSGVVGKRTRGRSKRRLSAAARTRVAAAQRLGGRDLREKREADGL